MKTRNKLLYIFLLLILTELTLRAQQKLGPLYDLESKNIYLGELSDTLNHRPPPGVGSFDKNSVRTNVLNCLEKEDAAIYSILFMGDSFMQGLSNDITIPQFILQYFKDQPLEKRKLVFFNAAYGSYSTAIFIPLAKKLVPLLKPDFVVVDIDETDMGDDYIRYRNLIVRDDSGSITAVRETPINRIFLQGMIDICNQPLYLTRFFSKVYFTRVYMPIQIKKYRVKEQRNVLCFSTDRRGNARNLYSSEISFFAENVSDLMRTLVKLMGGDNTKIMVVYHPHLQHLVPDKNGFIWNNFVSDTLQKVTARYGVTFYNATADLKKIFGNHPEKYYLPHDMHFNEEGLEAYSLLIAQKLYQRH